MKWAYVRIARLVAAYVSARVGRISRTISACDGLLLSRTDYCAALRDIITLFRICWHTSKQQAAACIKAPRGGAFPSHMAAPNRDVLISELLDKLSSGASESEATNACAVLVMLSTSQNPPLELLDMVRFVCAARYTLRYLISFIIS